MIIRLARRPEEESNPQASPEQDRRAEDMQCLYQQISVDRRTPGRYLISGKSVTLDKSARHSHFGPIRSLVMRLSRILGRKDPAGTNKVGV